MSDVDEVLARPYRRLLTPDGAGGFVASIHEFPGCIADGSTANEAMLQLEVAARGWIKAALATGYPIPEPANYDDFSGKIALRISRRLHKMATERAALEGTSVNQLLSNAIAHFLGQADGLSFAVRELRSACVFFADERYSTMPIALWNQQTDVTNTTALLSNFKPQFLPQHINKQLVIANG